MLYPLLSMDAVNATSHPSKEKKAAGLFDKNNSSQVSIETWVADIPPVNSTELLQEKASIFLELKDWKLALSLYRELLLKQPADNNIRHQYFKILAARAIRAAIDGLEAYAEFEAFAGIAKDAKIQVEKEKYQDIHPDLQTLIVYHLKKIETLLENIGPVYEYLIVRKIADFLKCYIFYRYDVDSVPIIIVDIDITNILREKVELTRDYINLKAVENNKEPEIKRTIDFKKSKALPIFYRDFSIDQGLFDFTSSLWRVRTSYKLDEFQISKEVFGNDLKQQVDKNLKTNFNRGGRANKYGLHDLAEYNVLEDILLHALVHDSIFQALSYSMPDFSQNNDIKVSYQQFFLNPKQFKEELKSLSESYSFELRDAGKLYKVEAIEADVCVDPQDDKLRNISSCLRTLSKSETKYLSLAMKAHFNVKKAKNYKKDWANLQLKPDLIRLDMDLIFSNAVNPNVGYNGNYYVYQDNHFEKCKSHKKWLATNKLSMQVIMDLMGFLNVNKNIICLCLRFGLENISHNETNVDQVDIYYFIRNKQDEAVFLEAILNNYSLLEFELDEFVRTQLFKCWEVDEKLQQKVRLNFSHWNIECPSEFLSGKDVIKAIMNRNRELARRFLQAVESGNMGIVKWYLEEVGVSPNAYLPSQGSIFDIQKITKNRSPEIDGKNALIIAAEKNHGRIARYLRKQGASLSFVMSTDATQKKSYADIVKMLEKKSGKLQTMLEYISNSRLPAVNDKIELPKNVNISFNQPCQTNTRKMQFFTPSNQVSTRRICHIFDMPNINYYEDIIRMQESIENAYKLLANNDYDSALELCNQIFKDNEVLLSTYMSKINFYKEKIKFLEENGTDVLTAIKIDIFKGQLSQYEWLIDCPELYMLRARIYERKKEYYCAMKNYRMLTSFQNYEKIAFEPYLRNLIAMAIHSAINGLPSLAEMPALEGVKPGAEICPCSLCEEQCFDIKALEKLIYDKLVASGLRLTDIVNDIYEHFIVYSLASEVKAKLRFNAHHSSDYIVFVPIKYQHEGTNNFSDRFTYAIDNALKQAYEYSFAQKPNVQAESESEVYVYMGKERLDMSLEEATRMYFKI